jgi:hypothetical protein
MKSAHRRGWITSGLLAASLIAVGPAAPQAHAGDTAQTPTRLLLGPGSEVPGSPIGDVAFAPQRVVYGDDGWAMNITMDGYIEMIVAENGLGVHEGLVLPAGDVVDEIWLSLDSDTSGRLATSVILDDESRSQALTLDDAVVLAEGDTIDTAGLESGSVWASITAVDLDLTDHLLAKGTVEEPSSPGVFIDVIVRFDVDAGGALSSPLVLASTKELVAGRPIDRLGYYSEMTFGTNAAGQFMHTVRFVPEVDGDPGPSAIVLDGVVLAEDGQESMVTGRDWVVSYGDRVQLNELGDYAFLTKIVAGPNDSIQLLVHNGEVVALQGAEAPGLPGTEITRIHAPKLADDGTLLLLIEWDEPGSFIGKDGFFVDGRLVVETVATQIEGYTLSGVNNSETAFDIAPDGSRFIFVGYPGAVAGWGSYEVPTGPWQDMGNALAGTGGDAPTLFGLGSLEVGTQVSLDLAGALPGSTTTMVIGISELGVPFKGGVMHPSPDVLVFGLPVDGNGELSLAGTFPSGLPSGVPLYFQFWTSDVGAPEGFSASNALEATTP